MKPLLIVLLAIMTATAAGDTTQPPDRTLTQVTVLVPTDFPPYYSLDKDNKPQGFAVEFMNGLARNANLTITYDVKDSWEDVFTSAQAAEVPIIIPNVGITRKREHFLRYTTPVESFGIGLFARSSSDDISDITSLAGRNVGVVKRNAAVAVLNKHRAIGVVPYEHHEEAFFALLSGDIDALAYPSPTMWRLASKLKLSNRIIEIGKPLAEIKRAVAMNHGYDTLYIQLNESAAAFIKTPEYRAIYTKWFGTRDPYWTPRRMLIMMIATGSVIILLLAMGIPYLRYKTIKQLNAELDRKIQEQTSALKHANRELNVEKNRADAANKAKSEFLANMSHEIRTPMNAILGFASILRSKDKDPQHQHYLDSIQSSGRVLLSLINDILDLSKVEAGKLTLQYSAASIQTLCADVNAILSHKSAEKNLEFVVDLQENIPSSLIVDVGRLKQVLLNLMGNAIKFTEKGSVTLSAHFTYSENTSKSRVDLTFTVTDTGAGIPADEQSHIFDAFEQVRYQKTAKFGGTGLGLTICKKLVSMMEGTIHLTSQPDQGSTFTVTIPGVEVAATKPLNTSEHDPKKENLTFKPAKILIVDDIDYNREMLASYLSEWNFDIVFAENGQEAIDQCRLHRPALILMDIKMPGMDGEEATRILKKDTDLKHIPIVVVTASTQEDNEGRIRHICDRYMRKPIDIAQLTEVLKSLLPYSITEKVTSTSENSEINNAPLSQDMRNKLCNELKALLPIQAKLSKAPLFGEVNAFITTLQELLMIYPSPELQEWTSNLKLSTDHFDAPQLKRSLGEFYELITTITKKGDKQ